jgi:hypothetical protein
MGAHVAAFGDRQAQRLYEAYHEYNARFWGGKLAAPLIQVTPCSAARAWGDYTSKDVHGLTSKIRVAPKQAARGDLWAKDIVLHEMVHAWQYEIAKIEDVEMSYRGHGPRFAAECNRIGAQLGLPPVGVKGRRGLPDCAHWPFNVRPDGYYPEPYQPATRTPKQPTEPEPEQDDEPDEGRVPEDATIARMMFLVRQLDDATAKALYQAIGDELTSRAWERAQRRK